MVRPLAVRQPERDPVAEFPVKPRPAEQLLVSSEGQVNRKYFSRPMLPMALEEFARKKKLEKTPLRELLRLDTRIRRPTD